MADRPVVRIRVVPPDLGKKIARLNPAKRTQMINRSLLRSGEVVTRESQKAMIRGGSGPPHPTRLTSRTGTGRRSITPDRRVSKTAGGFRLDVGTELIYMGVHETGGTFQATSTKGTPFTLSFPPRPFLEPGLDKSRIKIERIFTQEWLRIIGSA